MNKESNESKKRYYHLRMNGGTVTAVTELTDMGVTNKVGLAFCSPKDQFKKAKGRMIAEGRLSKCPIYVKHSGNSMDDVKRLIHDIETGVYPDDMNITPRWLVTEKPVTKPIRKLALTLLDNDMGISRDAWDTLRLAVEAEGGNEDVIEAIRYCEGHYYLPSDFAKELQLALVE